MTNTVFMGRRYVGKQNYDFVYVDETWANLNNTGKNRNDSQYMGRSGNLDQVAKGND